MQLNAVMISRRFYPFMTKGIVCKGQDSQGSFDMMQYVGKAVVILNDRTEEKSRTSLRKAGHQGCMAHFGGYLSKNLKLINVCISV